MKCFGATLLVFVLGHKTHAQELAWLQRASNSATVQVDDYEQPFVPLLTKPPGKRMAKTGRTLTLTGAGMAAAGLIYFNVRSEPAPGTDESGIVDAFVMTGMVSGMVMMVPGSICWIVGSSRYRKYERNFKGSVAIGRDGPGLRLHF